MVLLHQVFDKLVQASASATSSSSSQKDTITPSELLAHYDHVNHPDLRHKPDLTESALYDEFLQTFDVGQTVPNRITRDEFIGYYHNLASVVQDDDYLEMILRAVWHLPQGNLRVVAPMQQQQQQARRPSSANSISSNRSKERIQSAQIYSQQQRPQMESYGGNNNDMMMGLQGQSFNRRPSSASVTNQTQRRTSQPQDNGYSDIDHQECYKQGIQYYNAQQYDEAYAMFLQAKQILQSMYPLHHPECQKIEKSLVLVERKAKYYNHILKK